MNLFFLTYCCPFLNNKDTEWLYFRSNFQLFQTILSQKELANGIWQCGILILEVLLGNVFHIKESLRTGGDFYYFFFPREWTDFFFLCETWYCLFKLLLEKTGLKAMCFVKYTLPLKYLGWNWHQIGIFLFNIYRSTSTFINSCRPTERNMKTAMLRAKLKKLF